MYTIDLEHARELGPVRPLNGVNNGPLTCSFSQDARPLFREAAIPFSRLHDTEYPFGSGEFVDVDCVFKNRAADENDSANYNFTLTDEYLKAIRECGTQVIYRLGCTIEHQPVKVHAVPPADPLKWARVCEHIIRHVNEGWANGHHMDIRYWEIWNEPELEGHQCWTGTVEEYCDFYVTVSRYLKDRFPELYIGGPAAAWAESPLVTKLLDRLGREEKPVLDFFSWHKYMTLPRPLADEARMLRALLDSRGFTRTQLICDEWNYVESWDHVSDSWQVIPTLRGAAFDAAVMIELQDSPCDIATYYDAQLKFTGSWCGLFGSGKMTVHGTASLAVPRKPFYAFKAFSYLAGGTQLSLPETDGDLYILAALKDGKKRVLIANYGYPFCREETIRVAENDFDVLMLDEERDLAPAGILSAGKKLTLPPFGVCLLLEK